MKAKRHNKILEIVENSNVNKELRLKQQYFFVSASIQRAVARYMETHDDIHGLPDKVVFQLNDSPFIFSIFSNTQITVKSFLLPISTPT